MLFFSLGLLVAVVLLAVIHVREARQRPLAPAIRWVMVAVVIPASAATAVQVHRIGDSEARSAWGNNGRRVDGGSQSGD